MQILFQKPKFDTMKKILCVVFLSVILWSCGNEAAERKEKTYKPLYETRYAERFRLLEGDDGEQILRILNPWQGADSVVMDYRLIRDEDVTLQPGDIRWPLRRVVCMSSSHVAFLDAVGKVDVVKGVSGKGFISNPKIQAAGNAIRDVGYEGNLNFEMLVGLKPDAVFVYGVLGDDAAVGKMKQLGVPVVYIADYLENDPLGRAEWLIPFGLLVGRMDDAVKRFVDIETGYRELRDSVLVKVTAERPKVMLNAPYKDIWYLPGDRSYMIQLIRDAGGDYLGKGHDSDVSRPVSSEKALVLLSEADYWLNPGMARTMEELKADNRRFSSLPVVAEGEGKVYNNNARITPAGGSDFWESGAVRPDRVLKDLIHILHPGLLPEEGESSLYYFHKLK